MTDTPKYDIDSLLEDVITLPSMPSTLARITELLDNPDTPLSEVGQAVALDPAIAMKTLRLVNSAYYGLGQEVRTVDHAVTLLGVKVMRNLVLTGTVFETIKEGTDQFMNHSVAGGLAMRIFAEHSPTLCAAAGSPEEAFVFGLLHDIGKVVFHEYLPEEYERIAARAASEKEPWFVAERAIIGVDHALLGARLAEQWKLSPAIVNAIAGHHDLEQCEEEYRVIAACLGVCDYLCAAAGFPGYPKPIHDIPELVWALATPSPEALPELLNDFFDNAPSIAELVETAS